MSNNKKNKKNNSKKPVAPRNPVVEIARKRTSAGPMKSKNQKRHNRNSWRKLLDRLIDGA